jgi:hypothetical protein
MKRLLAGVSLVLGLLLVALAPAAHADSVYGCAGLYYCPPGSVAQTVYSLPSGSYQHFGNAAQYAGDIMSGTADDGSIITNGLTRSSIPWLNHCDGGGCNGTMLDAPGAPGKIRYSNTSTSFWFAAYNPSGHLACWYAIQVIGPDNDLHANYIHKDGCGGPY